MGSFAYDLMVSALARAEAEPPAPVLDKIKLCLLDYLSCAWAATEIPCVAQALRVVGLEGQRAPGFWQAARGLPVREQSRLAFVTAVAGHCLVRDDIYPAGIAHLGVAVWPVVLAIGSVSGGVSRHELVQAALAGYEVGAGVGELLLTHQLNPFLRPSCFSGTFAAVAAGSVLMHLNHEQVESAFGFAANLSGGLNQWPYSGGEELYFHPAFIAANAITALQLAASGVRTSGRGALDGRANFFKAYAAQAVGREPPSPHTQRDYKILAVFNKMFSGVIFAQAPCQAALTAVRDSGISVTSIEAIRIGVGDTAYGYPGAISLGPFAHPLQTKMSVPYCVADVLAHSLQRDPAVTEEAVELKRLLSVTTIERDVTVDVDGQGPGGRVHLTLKDGRTLNVTSQHADPAGADFVRKRFLRTTAAAFDSAYAADVMESIEGLDVPKFFGSLEQAGLRRGSNQRRVEP